MSMRGRTRLKVYTEIVPVKLSKDLIKVADYIVSNYKLPNKRKKLQRVYRGRSSILRASFIAFAKKRLEVLGNSDMLSKVN